VEDGSVRTSSIGGVAEVTGGRTTEVNVEGARGVSQIFGNTAEPFRASLQQATSCSSGHFLAG
jgi:hypothetical protein